jgi:hypothetical protein
LLSRVDRQRAKLESGDEGGWVQVTLPLHWQALAR